MGVCVMRAYTQLGGVEDLGMWGSILCGNRESQACTVDLKKVPIGKPKGAIQSANAWQSDHCVVPAKSPNNALRRGEWRRRWRKGGGARGRQAGTHAPDTEPGQACHQNGEPAATSWKFTLGAIT